MITLINEYDSFETLINDKLKPIELIAEAKKQPTVNQAVFLVVNTSSEKLNLAMVQVNRSYQLIFYAKDMFKAMELHSKVEALFNKSHSLACENRFIKINDVSLSRVFITDSGLHSFLCMVEGSFSVPRQFEEVIKMAEINATVTQK